MLVDNPNKREELAEILQEIPDVERILGRVLNLSVTPRDISAIRKALGQIPKLKMFLSSISSFEPVLDIASRIESVSMNLDSLKDLVQKAIVDNPPAKISDGGVIRENFNAELDQLRNIRKDSQKLLIEIEAKEREKTQISSLKISYNSVFGYYIEVTKPHLSKVPNYYVRKQTLVNAERYITQDLKELESRILGAEERMLKLEFHLFAEIKETVLENLKELRTFALCVSELDAFYGLADSSIQYDYVKPEISLDDEILIEEGRHPVVERFLPSGSFVPNDLKVGEDNPKIIILTGPNMSGKSVYLRQNALITIMAQMGSFVPAVSARIGIVDRIMTRIGAHDKLFSGESTFMVEMKETSSILNLATDKSLILLDEVGRGTSTFDGISIAWAVIEYLHKQKSRAKVLFATHYFELTELAEKFQSVKNFNVSVKEWTNALGKTEVVFLHRIVPGPADKSYGIHVAQLAGLPDSCIKRAKEILKKLESKTDIKVEGNGETEPLLPMFSSHPVLDEIKLCDPDKMTPLEALNAVHEWKNGVNSIFTLFFIFPFDLLK
jgi:DNA mismatch repair protein MutS